MGTQIMSKENKMTKKQLKEKLQMAHDTAITYKVNRALEIRLKKEAERKLAIANNTIRIQTDKLKHQDEVIETQKKIIEMSEKLEAKQKAKFKASELTENNAEKHLQLAENALKRKDEEIAINNEDIEHLEHTIATQLETINHKDEQLKVKDIQIETLKQLIKDEMRS